MEDFVLLEGTQTLASSRKQINNALLSVRSLSSGASFPTTNVVDGMLCYRPDTGKLYQYNASQEAWTNEFDIAASEARVAEISYDCEGNAQTATALETAHKINGVPFDGTKDIELAIDIAHGGTGATTAEQAIENLGAVSNTNAVITADKLEIHNNDDTAKLSAYEDSTALFRIDGDTLSEGSMLRLFDEYFSIRAGGNDNENKKYVIGNTDGSLLWDNKSICTLEISKGQNGYIRDTQTGFTIQWGYNTNQANPGTVTFPRAFSTLYTIFIEEMSNKTRATAVGNTSTTGFTAYLSANDNFYWIALGIS